MVTAPPGSKSKDCFCSVKSITDTNHWKKRSGSIDGLVGSRGQRAITSCRCRSMVTAGAWSNWRLGTLSVHKMLHRSVKRALSDFKRVLTGSMKKSPAEGPLDGAALVLPARLQSGFLAAVTRRTLALSGSKLLHLCSKRSSTDPTNTSVGLVHKKKATGALARRHRPATNDCCWRSPRLSRWLNVHCWRQERMSWQPLTESFWPFGGDTIPPKPWVGAPAVCVGDDALSNSGGH